MWIIGSLTVVPSVGRNATNYINTNIKSVLYARVHASGNILIGWLPPRESCKRERRAANFRRPRLKNTSYRSFTIFFSFLIAVGDGKVEKSSVAT